MFIGTLKVTFSSNYIQIITNARNVLTYISNNNG